MTKIWCKLWNFILNAINGALEAVGHALVTLGEVLVDVFTVVAEGVSDVLGVSPLTLVLLGVGAYLLFFSPKDKDEKEVTHRYMDSMPNESGGLINV